MEDLREYDQKAGLWVLNSPYVLSAETFWGAPQAYQARIERHHIFPFEPQENDDIWSNLFETVPNPEVLSMKNTYFMNGRTFYFVEQRSLPRSIPARVRPLRGFEEVSFPFNPMFKLICSGFRVEDIFQFFKTADDLCTTFGSQISQSLIKIASQRIFAEPEQSIMELPVNSLDSYRGSEGGQVGKFGMGFFSILYWLVEHSERTLTIESFHEGIRFLVVIQKQNNELTFSLKYGKTGVPQTGTRVVLDCALKPFTDHNVKVFKEQMDKLRFTSSSLIACRFSTNSEFKRLNQADIDNPNVVYVEVTKTGIIVEDFAQGISVDTLLTKLFVPSVSTKTIAVSLQREEKSEGVDLDLSRLERARQNTVSFLVHNVAVVSLPFESLSSQKYSVILSLSGNTRVPVSRDDILLIDQTQAELVAIVDKLVTVDCLALRNVAVLQLALQAYEKYTTLQENKQFFIQLASQIGASIGDKIMVEQQYAEMLMQPLLDRDARVIAATRTESAKLLPYLDSTVRSDSTLFWEKKVVVVPDVPNISTSAGLAKYLFVDDQFVQENPNDWTSRLALSTFTDKLYVTEESKVAVSFDEELNREYRDFVELTYMGMVGVPIPSLVLTMVLQIILKLKSLLDIYKLGLFLDNVYYREGKADRRLVASNEVCMMVENGENREIFCIVKDLVAINIVSETMAVNYYYKFYSLLNQFTETAPILVYGRTPKLSINATFLTVTTLSGNVHFNSFKVGEETRITRTTVSELFVRFPQLESMVYDSISLSLEAYVPSQYLCLWCTLNPLYLVYKSWVIMNYVSANRNNKYDILMMDFESHNLSFISFFVIYLLENFPDMHWTEFWVVTTLLSSVEYLFRKFRFMMYDHYEKFSMTDTRKFFPLLQFLREFVRNNIFDLEGFIKERMIYQYKTGTENYGVPNLLRNKFNLALEFFCKNLKETPILPPISLSSLPNANTGFHFTESQLINYVLKREVVQGENLFEQVTQFQDPNPIPLQLTEIAINEGSTKSFVEALLIETIQNSVDAIRETLREGLQVRADIHLSLSDSSDALVFCITDYVGIPFKGIVSLMIPFLSSKTASQFVTGEMGSGFFNLYRESSQVIVHTTLNGQSLVIEDTPVRNLYNRVVELQRAVQQDSTTDANQTSIYVVFKKNRLGSSLLNVVTNFVFFIYTVVSLIPQLQDPSAFPVQIYFQNERLDMVTQLVEETPKFTSKLVKDAQVPSYLFTKGVPFLKLPQFLINAGLIPQYALPYLEYSIIVNVQNGVYTPVQTRAKINMSTENREAMTLFLTTTLYQVTLLKITSGLVSMADEYLENFSSSSNLCQLLPHEVRDVTLENAGSFNRFMMYYEFNGLDSFATLINKAYAIMKHKKFEYLLQSEKNAIEQLTPHELQRHVLKLWLKEKNKPENTTGTALNATSALPPDVVSKLQVVFQVFTTQFWRLGQLVGLIPGGLLCPAVQVKQLSDPSTQAYYDSSQHSVVINTLAKGMDPKSVEKFLHWFQNVRELKGLQALDSNPLFNSFLKCCLPARILIHELEHARRGQVHNLQGAHGEVTLQIPGERPQIVQFDQAANRVYQYLISQGLWAQVLRNLPRV